MKAIEAINKIAELLNFHFKKESFATTKTTEGKEITNNLEDDFQIGQILYVVGESTLTPAIEGVYETTDMKINVDAESVIISIESLSASEADAKANEDVVEETTDEVMTRAEDAQGQILESSTFDVGEPIFVVKEDGTTEPAKDGEHQVVLKDESGNENKIRVMVKDGVIVERSNVEEMSEIEEVEEETPDLSSLLEVLLPIVEEMKKMKSTMGEIKEAMASLTNDFEKYKKSPEKFSVMEKKTYKQSLEDYKLEVIKAMINK